MSIVAPPDIPQELIARYNQPGSLPGTHSAFLNNNGIGATHYAAALEAAGTQGELPLSVYVHLPFCPIRCLNCEHNTTITHDSAKIDAYLDSLETEMGLVTARLGKQRPLLQLHLGGGTPNYLTDTQLVRLMSMLEGHFKIDERTETSLEANPMRASSAQLDLLRGLGFYRINFGVRDLDANVQRAIGRSCSFEVLRDVFWNARDVGFETISMDLVYGLPGQTMASIERTIDGVIDLAPDRIACFPYTRRPEALPHQLAIDPEHTPALAEKLALFNAMVQGLTAARYTWIGLDCFAKDDDELSLAQAQRALKRNWMGYTLVSCANFVGLGTNAVSELRGLCVQNRLQIEPWQGALAKRTFPILGGVSLSQEDQRRREAMVELMCNMELRDYAALFGSSDVPSTWSTYARDGLLDVSSERVSVTPQGRYFLRHICLEQAPEHGWEGIQWRYPQVI